MHFIFDSIFPYKETTHGNLESFILNIVCNG